MSTAMTQQDVSATAIEKVLLGGDLKDLSVPERLSYYNRVCESLGLNPLTQPFAYLSLSGKLTLYARKDAAEQLRQVRGISLKILAREMIDGMYVVTCEASTPAGRTDAATGVIECGKLQGEAKANAMMKCETKAKRRVTLSICGLGLIDETEVDGVPGARKVSVEDAHSGKLLSAPAQDGASRHEPQPDARPIPEELRDAVSKLRLGDIGVVKTASAFLQTSVVEACGTDGLWLKETAKLREAYPKPQVIPTEAMVSMWLDCWAIIESARFAESVNG